MSSHPLGSPGPSAYDIQSHLYLAFLQGRTADVALRITGSWNAIYKLHRVVLIQSGFFRSLFTGGFSESAPRLHSHQYGADQIELVFDDRNITRAAFEVCISRLYGGGPQLYVPPNLIPTTTQPLSPSFNDGYSWSEMPLNHHPASPRFLLSLLATAVFLSIPSVASQSLSLILSTIGPHTVIQYLNFATGVPITPSQDGEPAAAVGLEHIAQMIHIDGTDFPQHPTSVHDSEVEELPDAVSSLRIHKEDPSDGHSSSISEESFNDKVEPSFYYGAISDKIGESCTCWLARWAPDMLAYEEFLEGAESRPPLQQTAAAGHSILNQSRVTVTNIPAIWRCGGLSAKWVSALISSNFLFVRGESERYEFARRVVELRRRSAIIGEEEIEWAKMFQRAIYYENMTMDDMIKMSQDISPTTNRPFVPLSTLQAAHWKQSIFRHHVTSKPQGPSTPLASPTTSSPARDKELGLTQTTEDIVSSSLDRDRVYFPIPGDSSARLGDNGSLLNDKLPATMDELYQLLQSPHFSPSLPTSNTNSGSNVGRKLYDKGYIPESSFFNLVPQRHAASTCIQDDPSGKRKWSQYPPYRFAVEFWDLDSLREKSRLHSHTIWYAGSLFNVYVQIVKKKGQVQLGIYLHRQSSIDPIPGPSSPSPSLCSDVVNSSRSSGERPHTQQSLFAVHATAVIPPNVALPPSRPTSQSYSTSQAPASPTLSHSLANLTSSGSHSLPATGSPVAPRQPYRDPRPSISAYFTISCASATGSTQTRFTSAPDIFSVSQSWGWKSSSLRTEEYMEVRDEHKGTRTTPFGSEVSLRATVVLGLI
ncbi:hypothetical protein AMATHDRAFT_185472 [Amanita thiersii Skay4041]|uniref:BTB domain-containing protein n=1 Tax=Amanita thiersii Skay4041 TaxID=703135 RepID=A0A2A9P1L8_9AGAR|nr:hypothetical protein AMATHDRAFT_185472 [Amanita thiersii Skay4041]